MQLMKIVSPFLEKGADLDQVLRDLDVRLVMESRETHGYGELTDRIMTATMEVRYQEKVIYTEEDYDITSS